MTWNESLAIKVVCQPQLQCRDAMVWKCPIHQQIDRF